EPRLGDLLVEFLEVAVTALRVAGQDEGGVAVAAVTQDARGLDQYALPLPSREAPRQQDDTLVRLDLPRGPQRLDALCADHAGREGREISAAMHHPDAVACEG